jgi:hypothetical protein
MSQQNSLWWAAGAFLLTSGIFLASLKRSQLTPKAFVIALVAGLFAGAMMWFAIVVMMPLEKRWDNYLQSIGIAYGAAVAGSGLATAGVLYWLKVEWLRVYAALECMLGILALVVFSEGHAAIDIYAPQTFATSDLIGWIAGFAAPVYILIRGFTNLGEARKNDAKKAAEDPERPPTAEVRALTPP